MESQSLNNFTKGETNPDKRNIHDGSGISGLNRLDMTSSALEWTLTSIKGPQSLKRMSSQRRGYGWVRIMSKLAK